MALGDRRVLDPTVPSPQRPLRQRLPVPIVSGVVLGLSISIWAYSFFVDETLVETLGLFGPLVVEGGQWYRTITSIFTHDVQFAIVHILFNMSVVWTLGIYFERIIGSMRFLLVSIVTALGSSALALAFAYESNTIGASGMIIGWGSAMLPILSGQQRQAIRTWLIQIAVISALPLISPSFPISWQGHLGGFLFGIPCGLLLRHRAHHFFKLMPVLIVLSVVAVVVAASFGASMSPGGGP